MGVTKSQFIVSALERALGRKNPYELLLKVQAEVREPLPEGNEFLSPTKAAIRSKLKAKQHANQADWLAFHEAKKQGKVWSGSDPETDKP
jgi:RHH-type rel operon transcriptional repressor/antitoxin RelB